MKKYKLKKGNLMIVIIICLLIAVANIIGYNEGKLSKCDKFDCHCNCPCCQAETN